VLEIKNLTVNYGAIEALHGISLNVEAGKIITLIGSNGAGKSTTLRTVCGLLKPRGGEILYEGKTIAGLPPHKLVHQGLAHVPEGRMIFANLTVRENLQMGAYLQTDRHIIRQEFDYAFGMFPRLKEREKQIEKVIESTTGLYGSIKGIAGSAVRDIKALELDSEDDLLLE